MKKLLISLLGLIVITSSAVALEKPAYPEVDAETLRIEEEMGEHPEERIYYQKRLAELDKEKLSVRINKLKEESKQKSGAALQKIKEKIRHYENAIKAKLK